MAYLHICTLALFIICIYLHTLTLACTPYVQQSSDLGRDDYMIIQLFFNRLVDYTPFFFFIRTKFIRRLHLDCSKTLRTILDFKSFLFLNLTYVLIKNDQGLFYSIILNRTLVPSKNFNTLSIWTAFGPPEYGKNIYKLF